jgi:hypothetical protein
MIGHLRRAQQQPAPTRRSGGAVVEGNRNRAMPDLFP